MKDVLELLQRDYNYEMSQVDSWTKQSKFNFFNEDVEKAERSNQMAEEHLAKAKLYNEAIRTIELTTVAA